ncbi:lppC lipofamily protein, partial [Escherichia coli 88.1042]
RLAI